MAYSWHKMYWMPYFLLKVLIRQLSNVLLFMIMYFTVCLAVGLLIYCIFQGVKCWWVININFKSEVFWRWWIVELFEWKELTEIDICLCMYQYSFIGNNNEKLRVCQYQIADSLNFLQSPNSSTKVFDIAVYMRWNNEKWMHPSFSSFGTYK